MSKKKVKAKATSKAKEKTSKSKAKPKTKFKFAKAAPEIEEAAEEVTEEPIDDVNEENERELEALEDDGGLDLEFAEDDEASADDLADTDENPDDLLEASEDDVVMEVSSDEESEEELLDHSLEILEASTVDGEASADADPAIENSELGAFESAEIEDVETISADEIRSIVESVLFTTDKPISIALIKQAFKGTQVKSKDIREALTSLSEEYLNSSRGFTLDEIAGGFQLRSKPENMKYLRQSVKARPFKLSGPALEVLSIVAYKQPVTKAQIDEIRGVESGHLLRALMEKHLLTFGERSDLPGKPMFYETARKFLEIFGLRNLQELPSLHEIEQLIPEGIGEEEKKETLSDLTGELSTATTESYSVGEEELLKITDELSQITTSSDFFEKEKERMREKRDNERAQSIREAMLVGETVEDKDRRWLERFDAAKLAREQGSNEVAFITEGILEGESPSEARESDQTSESELASETELANESEMLISSDESVTEEMLAEEANAVSGEDALFEDSREPEQEL